MCNFKQKSRLKKGFKVRVRYLIGQNFGGQNCRKSDLLPKILSAENFVRRKILSAENFVHRNFVR